MERAIAPKHAVGHQDMEVGMEIKVFHKLVEVAAGALPQRRFARVFGPGWKNLPFARRPQRLKAGLPP